MPHCCTIYLMKQRKAGMPLWKNVNLISANSRNSHNSCSMNKTRAWIISLRLRTLPLALASTGMGSFLAAGFKVFNLQTCLLASLTAILLQILSNLANDYGDYKTGADNEDRIGPQRALQSGIISISAMRNGI